MRTLNLTLPWPPSFNRIWRVFQGRILLSKAAREWKVAAANALPRGRVEPLQGRLVVTMQLCAPTSVKCYDIANREKIVADTLTEQRVWLDDEQVDVWLIMRGEPCAKGQVDILIKEY